MFVLIDKIDKISKADPGARFMVFLRGVPGAGKSTFGKLLARLFPTIFTEEQICETDKFFMGPQGYFFELPKLGANHVKNAEMAIALMHSGKSVIVSNTNMTHYEMTPYVRGAATAPKKPIVLVYENMDHIMGENVHGVPTGAIAGMKARFTPFDLKDALEGKDKPDSAMYPTNMPSLEDCDDDLECHVFVEDGKQVELAELLESLLKADSSGKLLPGSVNFNLGDDRDSDCGRGFSGAPFGGRGISGAPTDVDA
jgi:adenylylsulfate kinase-like enzyme